MKPGRPIPHINYIFQGQKLDWDAIGGIINQLPNPCFIYDNKKKIIFQVNSELIELTAFTRDELCGAPIIGLMKWIDTDDALERSERTLIQRKNKPPLEYPIQEMQLDRANRWILVILNKSEINRFNDYERGIFIKLIGELNLLQYEIHAEKYSMSALKIICEVFSFDYASVFLQVDPKVEELGKAYYFGVVDIFPERILNTEAPPLGLFDIWQPGKRILNNIHRAARKNELNFLIQIPVFDDNQKISGLMAFGKKENIEMRSVINILQMCVQLYFKNLNKLTADQKIIEKLIVYENKLYIYKELFDQSQTAVVFTDTELVIQDMNSATEMLLGYANWEVIGSKLDQMLICAEKYDQMIALALQERQTKTMDLVHIHRRDGTTFPAELRIVPVFSDDGGVNSKTLILLISNKSEIEKAKLQTNQLEQKAALGGYISEFAHDVRNPINSISLSANTLKLKIPGEDITLKLIDNIQEECMKANHLLESVLSFSRPLEEQFKPLAVNELINQSLERIRQRLEKRSIKLIFQQEDDIPKINGDARSLEQVLNNLVNNAIDAMGDTGGTLAVNIKKVLMNEKNNRVEIQITDSGPGIPKELMNKIFEPFVSTSQRGTGIGLAITKKIVLAHHGDISVDSFTGGTTFRVSLPFHGENI